MSERGTPVLRQGAKWTSEEVPPTSPSGEAATVWIRAVTVWNEDGGTGRIEDEEKGMPLGEVAPPRTSRWSAARLCVRSQGLDVLGYEAVPGVARYEAEATAERLLVGRGSELESTD